MWWLTLAITFIKCDTKSNSNSIQRRDLFHDMSDFMDYPTMPIKYYIARGTGTDDAYENWSMENCIDANAQATMENTIAAALQHVRQTIGITFEEVNEITSGVWIFGAIDNETALFEPTNNANPVSSCSKKCLVTQVGTYYFGTFTDFRWVNMIHLGTCYDALGSVIHEIGHKLGMAHEHTRADRNNYLDVNIADIDANWRSQWQFTSGKQRRQIGDFDMCSIQMYPIQDNAFGPPGTIQLTALGRTAIADCLNANPDLVQGNCDPNCRDVQNLDNDNAFAVSCQLNCLNRRGFSVGDIAALTEIYGSSPPTTSPTTSPTKTSTLTTSGASTSSKSPTTVPTRPPSKSPTTTATATTTTTSTTTGTAPTATATATTTSTTTGTAPTPPVTTTAAPDEETSQLPLYIGAGAGGTALVAGAVLLCRSTATVAATTANDFF